jgi:hypothetical protein
VVVVVPTVVVVVLPTVVVVVPPVVVVVVLPTVVVVVLAVVVVAWAPDEAYEVARTRDPPVTSVATDATIATKCHRNDGCFLVLLRFFTLSPLGFLPSAGLPLTTWPAAALSGHFPDELTPPGAEGPGTRSGQRARTRNCPITLPKTLALGLSLHLPSPAIRHLPCL